jgi:hypothetical protein
MTSKFSKPQLIKSHAISICRPIPYSKISIISVIQDIILGGSILIKNKPNKNAIPKSIDRLILTS